MHNMKDKRTKLSLVLVVILPAEAAGGPREVLAGKVTGF